MGVHTPWRLAVVLAVVAMAGYARAEDKDAAELLPAQTLASVEVRQPERLAREVAALVRGSDLEDMPAVMARFRERVGDNMPFWLLNETAMESLLFSPEMIGECGRIQGAIVGVTGVTKDGPEIVGVIQAGESNFPTFYLRAMLTADFNVRGVAETDGVRIYRERRQVFQAPAPNQPQPAPTWADSGPYMALLPSTVVLGSSAEGVKDVIRRFKGKNTDPSLASVLAYKQAGKRRDKPGLFAYADLAALAQQMDAAGKNLGPVEAEWRLVKALVNPKSVHAATASLTLQNGAVELAARIDLDPNGPCPLADLLTAKTASPDALAFAPRDGMLTVGLNLNDGEKRWRTLMDLADALDKPQPGEAERPAPSAALHDLESRLKLNVSKDVLGRLAGAAVVLEPAEAVAPQGRPVRLLVLQTTDPDAGKYLGEEGVPKLLALAALFRGAPEDAPAAVDQEVDGRRISVMKAVGVSELVGAKNLFVGREGVFVVIGSEAKEVADALNAGAKKEGLLNEDKTAGALKGLDAQTVEGVFSLGKAVTSAFEAVERSNPAPAIAPNRPVAPPVPNDQPPKPSKRAEKAVADMAKAVEPLPPTVVGLGRQPDGLTVEVRQAGLNAVSRKVIDLWIESILERVLEQQKPNGN